MNKHMTYQEKILANVKEQALVNGRLNILQRQFDELKARNERLNGGLDMVQQFLQEESGMTITEYFNQNPSFKEEIDKAISEGDALAVSGASSVPSNSETTLDVDTKTGDGIVRHDGNKKVELISEKEADPAPTELLSITPRTNSDTRKPPNVIVDDAPPPPERESREDARDPTPA